MPRRLGKTAHEFAYQYLCLRDGECCNLCLAVPDNPKSETGSATRNESIPATRNGDSTTGSATRNERVRRHEMKLQIDHLDGNKHNNAYKNLRLLCPGCNVAEYNRKRGRGDFSLSHKRRLRKQGNPATQTVRDAVDFSLGPPQMQANLMYEPRFRNWLLGKFREEGVFYLNKDDVVNSGAEMAGCSIATAITYLKKLTSSEGPLLEQPGLHGETFLRLKPEIVKIDDGE